jgi:hypothetical protein
MDPNPPNHYCKCCFCIINSLILIGSKVNVDETLMFQDHGEGNDWRDVINLDINNVPKILNIPLKFGMV